MALYSFNNGLVKAAVCMQAEVAHPLHIKKIYVLAAFEMEKARERNQAELMQVHGLTTLGGGFAAGQTMTAGTRAQATLQGLVTRDAAAAQVCFCCHDLSSSEALLCI
jgi:hypothetical protein